MLSFRILYKNADKFSCSIRNSYKRLFSTNPVKNSSFNYKKFAVFGGSIISIYAFIQLKDKTPKDYLNPDEFIPFIITNKADIDDDHYFIELTPKYNIWKSKDVEIWNGLKLWSVEVKQPQIMVVRRYTPLPLKFENAEIKIQDENDYKDGKLMFYIKKYNQGEVARWIYKKSIGSELELRGPYVEFEFPAENSIERSMINDDLAKIKPDKFIHSNIIFFAGGTGIAPILQSTLSKNPFKGFVEIFYSTKTQSEIPLKNYLNLLTQLDRVKVHYLNNKLNLKDIPSPIKNSNLIKLDDFDSINEQLAAKISKNPPSLAIVCGPDGYMNYVCGLKPYNTQGLLSGLLKERSWTEENVFKM